MLQILYEEKVVSIWMFLFFGIGVVLKFILGVFYSNMIREAKNLATTSNRLLRQYKLRFQNSYQVNNGIGNIPVFVDKFMGSLKAGPVFFDSLYHLSGQAVLLSVFAAGIGIYRSILAGKTLLEFLPFYLICFAELYFFFAVSAMVDLQGKKRLLKIYLVDYLENHLIPRMDKTQKTLEFEPIEKRENDFSVQAEENVFDEETAKELERMLQELLTS